MTIETSGGEASPPTYPPSSTTPEARPQFGRRYYGPVGSMADLSDARVLSDLHLFYGEKADLEVQFRTSTVPLHNAEPVFSAVDADIRAVRAEILRRLEGRDRPAEARPASVWIPDDALAAGAFPGIEPPPSKTPTPVPTPVPTLIRQTRVPEDLTRLDPVALLELSRAVATEFGFGQYLLGTCGSTGPESAPLRRTVAETARDLHLLTDRIRDVTTRLVDLTRLVSAAQRDGRILPPGCAAAEATDPAPAPARPVTGRPRPARYYRLIPAASPPASRSIQDAVSALVAAVQASEDPGLDVRAGLRADDLVQDRINGLISTIGSVLTEVTRRDPGEAEAGASPPAPDTALVGPASPPSEARPPSRRDSGEGSSRGYSEALYLEAIDLSGVSLNLLFSHEASAVTTLSKMHAEPVPGLSWAAHATSVGRHESNLYAVRREIRRRIEASQEGLAAAENRGRAAENAALSSAVLRVLTSTQEFEVSRATVTEIHGVDQVSVSRISEALLSYEKAVIDQTLATVCQGLAERIMACFDTATHKYVVKSNDPPNPNPAVRDALLEVADAIESAARIGVKVPTSEAQAQAQAQAQATPGQP